MCESKVHSFLWLSDNPLCGLYICPLPGRRTSWLFQFGRLWITLLETFLYNFFCEHKFLNSFGVEISRLFYEHIFNFIINDQTVFQYSCAWVVKIPVAPNLCQNLVLSSFLFCNFSNCNKFVASLVAQWWRIHRQCRSVRGCLVAQSSPTLSTPQTVACQAPLSMRFSRQEYWDGLPFPFPGDLPHPGIEPRFPAFQADSLLIELWGKPVQETLVRSLGWEGLLEKEMATHSSNPMDRGAWWVTVHGGWKRVRHDLVTEQQQ